MKHLLIVIALLLVGCDGKCDPCNDPYTVCDWNGNVTGSIYDNPSQELEKKVDKLEDEIDKLYLELCCATKSESPKCSMVACHNDISQGTWEYLPKYKLLISDYPDKLIVKFIETNDYIEFKKPKAK